MLRQSRYFLAFCGAVFGIASFLIGLEVSVTTAATSIGATPAGITIVNRTLKSDRLGELSNRNRNAVNSPSAVKAPSVPTTRPELLEGCEPIVSAIGQPPLARVAGRCLS
jgi:hypothetical protein